MKYQKLAATFTAFALATSAGVAEESTTKTASPATKTDSQWLVDASKLDGTAVYDFHGNQLGDLQKVLVDPKSGRIRYGILEVNKSWNWDDPTVAVPWGSFAVKKGDDKMPNLSIDATKEKLEKAPKFKEGDADRLYGRQASAPIYSYWSIVWWDEPMTNDAGKPGTGNTIGNTGSGTGNTGSSTTDKTGTDTKSSGTTDTTSASGASTTKR